MRGLCVGAAVIASLTASAAAIPGHANLPIGQSVAKGLQPAVPSIENLPPTVAVVIGLDPAKMNYGARIQAANQLPKTLSQETQAVLFDFMKKTAAAGISEDELNALKNDILNALLEQAMPLPDFSQRLMDMYHADGKAGNAPTGSAGGSPASSTGVPPVNHGQDGRVTVKAAAPGNTELQLGKGECAGQDARPPLERQNSAWRDYCIQFLGIRYGKTMDAKERKAIQRVLNEALCDKEGAIAATALLALYRNVGADPDLAKEAASGALFLVRNDETSTAVRMTALQVGAELCAAHRTGVAVGQCDGVAVKTGTEPQHRSAGTAAPSRPGVPLPGPCDVSTTNPSPAAAPATAQPDAVQTPSPSVPTVSSLHDTARSGNGTPDLLPPNDPRLAGKVELLAIARKLAKDGKTPTVLRISAIAAIGTLGDATDRPMLDEMAKGGEHRLHAAATVALNKLK